MPKELIHFKIAERTAELLQDTRFAPCLNTQALLLGSVFHDALFYGVTPSARPLERLAHELHGANGQDTFTLLRLQAEHAAAAQEKELPTALLVGMISHVFGDAVMHPMVWHFSGDYYAADQSEKSRARQRHRALESLMDMVACPEMLGHPEYSLRLILRHANKEFATGFPLKKIAGLAGIKGKKALKEADSAWRTFATLQSLFPIKSLARNAFALRPYLPSWAAEIATLFYAPQLMLQAEALTGDIQFRHPVTGEHRTTTLTTLIDSAALQASNLCRSLETAIFDQSSIDLPEIGPSMDSGLSGVPTQHMSHYANPPFPRLTNKFRP
ncbi:MAG: zinc dependent phospholipase C family protein [Pseudodesulfovibrio sp.]|nr:zinc dependent phospholipase C family protein [Pseudodesulfovibrio sp.]